MGPEDSLNLLLATAFVDSREFLSWFLNRTKFSEQASQVRLLNEEQALAREAKYWWRHWWCNVPELKMESETDIFLAIEAVDTKRRFALHIENKIATSTFRPNQGMQYAIRARYMLNNTKSALLKCTDCDTVLIAPRSFQSRYREESGLFGCFISHEAIAKHIPAFNS